MNLHEYQSKILLKKYGVAVPNEIIAFNADEAVLAAKELNKLNGCDLFVVKAQVHAGGRGKGGGVKVAKNFDDVALHAKNIIGMHLVTPQTKAEGKLVRKVLIQENAYYPGPSEINEIYVSLLLNRNTGRYMIMYSPCGGMDIEKVAHDTPELIFTEEIDPKVGILPFQARRVAFNLKLNGVANKNMQSFITSLYSAFIGIDASLIEINPCAKTSDDKILAVDAKVVIDNSALFRHPDIEAMRDKEEEDPTDVEADEYGLNYVKLDGNVGCMVNGAGLAMATMDIIKLSGGEPANFLDVGGTANAKRVEEAFRIILKDKNVKAILVNIFGGIVRCDRVANGIVDAYKNIGNIPVPIIVRLQGTNAKEAKEIIEKSGLKVFSAIELQEAANLVKQVLS